MLNGHGNALTRLALINVEAGPIHGSDVRTAGPGLDVEWLRKLFELFPCTDIIAIGINESEAAQHIERELVLQTVHPVRGMYQGFRAQIDDFFA